MKLYKIRAASNIEHGKKKIATGGITDFKPPSTISILVLGLS